MSMSRDVLETSNFLKKEGDTRGIETKMEAQEKEKGGKNETDGQLTSKARKRDGRKQDNRNTDLTRKQGKATGLRKNESVPEVGRRKARGGLSDRARKKEQTKQGICCVRESMHGVVHGNSVAETSERLWRARRRSVEGTCRLLFSTGCEWWYCSRKIERLCQTVKTLDIYHFPISEKMETKRREIV